MRWQRTVSRLVQEKCGGAQALEDQPVNALETRCPIQQRGQAGQRLAKAPGQYAKRMR